MKCRVNRLRLKIAKLLRHGRLQRGQPITYDLAKVLYSYMTGNGVASHAVTKILGEEEDTFTLKS